MAYRDMTMQVLVPKGKIALLLSFNLSEADQVAQGTNLLAASIAAISDEHSPDVYCRNLPLQSTARANLLLTLMLHGACALIPAMQTRFCLMPALTFKTSSVDARSIMAAAAMLANGSKLRFRQDS